MSSALLQVPVVKDGEARLAACSPAVPTVCPPPRARLPAKVTVPALPCLCTLLAVRHRDYVTSA